MRSLVLLVLLGGCHKLFGLLPVDLESVDGDGGTTGADSTLADAAMPMCPISPVVYDEDVDSIDDRCDACPTIASDALDDDLDGLPNACDPNLIVGGDKILLAATFYEAVDLTAFTNTGATWAAADHGTVTLGGMNGVLRTVPSYTVSKIEIRTSGLTAASPAATFFVGTTTVTCQVVASECTSGAGGQTCVRLASSQGQLSSESSDLREVSLLRSVVPPTTVCRIDDKTAAASEATADLPLGVGQIQLATNGAATVAIQSIVVYGAK